MPLARAPCPRRPAWMRPPSRRPSSWCDGGVRASSLLRPARQMPPRQLSRQLSRQASRQRDPPPSQGFRRPLPFSRCGACASWERAFPPPRRRARAARWKPRRLQPSSWCGFSVCRLIRLRSLRCLVGSRRGSRVVGCGLSCRGLARRRLSRRRALCRGLLGGGGLLGRWGRLVCRRLLLGGCRGLGRFRRRARIAFRARPAGPLGSRLGSLLRGRCVVYGLLDRRLYSFAHRYLTFSQSALNLASPWSVSGCLMHFFMAAYGTVAMSAPMRAACVTWFAERTDAAMISTSWPKS